MLFRKLLTNIKLFFS